MQVPATCLTCGFAAGRGSRTLCLNSVSDGFGKCLDARSTLILTERDAVVLDQIARVDRQLAVTSQYRGTTGRAGAQRAPQLAIERLYQL